MIDRNDVDFEPVHGSGPGGQHHNKKRTSIRATHRPSGLTTVAQGRSQVQSKKLALAQLDRMVREQEASERKNRSKAKHEDRKANMKRIRTYDFKHNRVIDHRTGKQAGLRAVLDGNLELLR